MKAASLEALKRRALAMGGKLEIEGQAFNAARTQMTPIRKADAPQPAASVTPAAPDDRALTAIQSMAGATLAATKLQARVLQVMQTHMQAKPAARNWEFTIHRDAKGNLASIQANSKE